ncbi:MAG: endonuclease/exonuclease/phosphatase family protein [Sulfurimonas sp.]
MKLASVLLLLSTLVFGETNLKIATYNVENLFDLQKNGHEYTEYIPNTLANWNKKTYKIKLKNIAKVIKDINADIIALQEIESLQALKDLRYTLKEAGLYYQYFKIANRKNTTIKVAILSKIPFVYAKELMVTSSYKYRNILEVKYKINNQSLYLFVNHWKSKSGPESRRIVSAKVLRKRIKELGKDKNIVLLGDFNSDYEEYKLFKRKRKHNDTNGRTGINDVLHTKYQASKASDVRYNEKYLYNLWYDTNKNERYSYIYRGKKEAMDSIIISQSLLKNSGIMYKHDSIKAFKDDYIFKGKNIYRWKMSWRKPRKHKGKGYSDHLAVIANFVVE